MSVQRVGRARRARQRRRAAVRPRQALYSALFAALLFGLISFQFDRQSPWFYSFLSWGELLANGLIAAVLLAMLSLYLRYRRPELWQEERSILFLGGLVIATVMLDKGASFFSPYLVPVALAVGLGVIFFGLEVGFVLAVACGLLVGLGREISATESLVAWGGGLVMLFGARKIRRGGDLALAGIGVSLINMILLLGAAIPSGIWPWNALVWAGANGLSSYLLLLGGIPLSEYLTGKTSPLGLTELLSPAHPLMERLQREAPGTYHHARSVAQLGANAARAIGADPLLTEVGGYYHDIGKLENPRYFAENQEAGQNPHDELSPSMSKLVLTAHVRYGLELGRQFGLRPDVLRFIPEHHGTSVIRYFYLKALQERKEAISVEDFRYEAERPRTKETAIIMLADSVEAATRAVPNESLQEVIREQVRAKLEDGQLDGSPLTIADLHAIEAAFYETLRAMRHGRPESYPRPSDT
ncbi:MAG: HDIG domain-containing protein [Candidatus Acetothermia bacterium]|jgi:putative nucleotidyltransferase with HDIG domain|nr:HDIG domain-containing protein [Candidatus Acetothermia bacterium]MDH7505161.1 HDIG domain-containing protein [Candidatus Acetothermia bacterium]